MVGPQSSHAQTLYDVGALFGYSRTRRHPTAVPFIFTTQDGTDIFNIDETGSRLDKAIQAVTDVAASGKQVLFVGGKSEVMAIVKAAAERIEAPFVASRWIGGTLTNFKEIRRRVDRMEKLQLERERGELDKYTKKERLLISREIEELERRFSGLVLMKERPAALFVVDVRHEHIAVKEAAELGIPIIGVASSDCDFSRITYPIPANDSVTKSVSFFVSLIAETYRTNKRAPLAPPKRGGEAPESMATVAATTA
ncbi:MAG: 30S ribosomal protein S2 [Patescibacteria group bacterium]